MSRSELGLVVLLTALVALVPISTDMYLPGLPAVGVAFSADVATVQLTLAGFIVGIAVMQLVVGPLSDRFGRRPVLLGGLAVYALASAAAALAPSIELLIVARLGQALGACAGPAVGRAMLRDRFDRERAGRVLGYTMTAMGILPGLAPILGGQLLALWGWRAIFWTMTAYGLVLLTVIAWRLKESLAVPDLQAFHLGRMARNYGTMLRHRRYVGCMVTVCCSFGALFAFISGSAFVMIDAFAVPPSRFGYVFAVVVVGYMMGAFAGGRLVARLGLEPIVAVGLVLAGLGGAFAGLFAWTGTGGLGGVLIPATVLFAGAGIVNAQAVVGALGPFPQMAGAAAALIGFVQMSTGAVVAVALGALYDGTARPMATMMGVLALAGGAVFTVLVGTRRTG